MLDGPVGSILEPTTKFRGGLMETTEKERAETLERIAREHVDNLYPPTEEGDDK